MAMTNDELKALLESLNLNFGNPEPNKFIMSFETKGYQDEDGKPSLFIVVHLAEGGEYLTVFAPTAYKAEGDHVDAFLRALLMVQWRTKLIQFEYDPSDGEIRPTVEFPLMDAKLTARQLERCIRGLVQLVSTHHVPLTRALTEGVIKFDDDDESPLAAMQFALARFRASDNPADKVLADQLEALIATLMGAGAAPPTAV